jgi:long-subunit fatty acid transport protein
MSSGLNSIYINQQPSKRSLTKRSRHSVQTEATSKRFGRYSGSKSSALILFAAIGAFALSLSGESAQASGYEKSVLWGARAGGLSGAGSASVQGAEALYFNPAGLASGDVGQDFSLNLSPTIGQFKGVADNQNTPITGVQTFSALPAMIYSVKISDKIGLGIGGYIAGGARAQYDDVALFTGGGTASLRTDLSVSEISAGLGYKLSDSLNLGLAWRMSMAQAEFSLLQRNSTGSAINPVLTNLRDVQTSAFRAGMQWKLADRSNLSLVYRSEVNFAAKGDVAPIRLLSGGATLTLPNSSGTATAKTVLPQAVTLGYDRPFGENWVGYFEYVWTQYSRITDITLETTSPILGNAKVDQRWLDQHNLRLAAEYAGSKHPWRFGYGWTSQVTNTDAARSTFTPPGAAHTLSLGRAYNMTWSEKKAQFAWAFEYTTVSGDGTGAAAGASAPGTDIRAGTYSASAYALHTTFNHFF